MSENIKCMSLTKKVYVCRKKEGFFCTTSLYYAKLSNYQCYTNQLLSDLGAAIGIPCYKSDRNPLDSRLADLKIEAY